MSSHHIIRDQQEPALLIYKMDRFPLEILHSLLEWSPTVLCCEPSVDLYTQHGFKLDVGLVSHINYEDWKKNLEKQHPVKLVGIQGSAFLMTGITLLKKDHHTAINIVSDEDSLPEVLQECLLWSHEVDIVILTESRRHILQRSERYKKWLPASSSLHVLPLSEQSFFTTKGFDHDLDNVWLKEVVTLNKKEEGAIDIKSSKTPFLISENF